MICELALVLMLDASGSIADPEWRLQLEGHAEALADERIGRLMVRSTPTAVMAMAFSDRQDTLVEWTVVRTEEDVREFGRRLLNTRRPPAQGTQTGAALGMALVHLDMAPCAAEREVIDVVTDGRPDDGWMLERNRGRAQERGAVVNVLVVEGSGNATGGWAREVATEGGFVVESPTWEGFARAMRGKLSLEVGMVR